MMHVYMMHMYVYNIRARAHIYIYLRISIYIFVEPSSFVHKLLPQCVCNRRQTRPYYRAPHRECHKGVGGKRFVMAEKCAVQIPTLKEIDAMFFVRSRMGNARFRTWNFVCKKGGSMYKRRRLCSLARKST